MAHSRHIEAHADALFLDIRERRLACSMPIGIHTRLVFAPYHHANLAVRRTPPGPCYAFEWALLEKTTADGERVARDL